MDAIIDYRGKTPPKSDEGVWLVTAKVVKGGSFGTTQKSSSPRTPTKDGCAEGGPDSVMC